MTAQSTKSVGPSSPTLLVTAIEAQRSSDSPLGVLISSLPGNTQTVYLGGDTVTIGTGVPLLPGATAGFELWGSDSLYAIGPSGLQEIRVLIGPFVRGRSTSTIINLDGNPGTHIYVKATAPPGTSYAVGDFWIQP